MVVVVYPPSPIGLAAGSVSRYGHFMARWVLGGEERVWRTVVMSGDDGGE